MLHKFSTEHLGENCVLERVLIDGQPIRCSGYALTHNIDEVPLVSLELPVIPEIKDKTVIVQVSNKEEIARLMDKTEFEEFCRIWNGVH